jgi:hypothetical protein
MLYRTHVCESPSFRWCGYELSRPKPCGREFYGVELTLLLYFEAISKIVGGSRLVRKDFASRPKRFERVDWENGSIALAINILFLDRGVADLCAWNEFFGFRSGCPRPMSCIETKTLNQCIDSENLEF